MVVPPPEESQPRGGHHQTICAQKRRAYLVDGQRRKSSASSHQTWKSPFLRRVHPSRNRRHRTSCNRTHALAKQPVEKCRVSQVAVLGLPPIHENHRELARGSQHARLCSHQPTRRFRRQSPRGAGLARKQDAKTSAKNIRPKKIRPKKTRVTNMMACRTPNAAATCQSPVASRQFSISPCRGQYSNCKLAKNQR